MRQPYSRHRTGGPRSRGKQGWPGVPAPKAFPLIIASIETKEEHMVRQGGSKKTAIPFFAFIALALLMLTSSRAYAQVSGATLTGTVSDASGAVVPNAQVSIKNVATGELRAATTDTAGFYTAPNLLPGKYEVTVTAPGFSTEVQTGITLTVGVQ